MILRAIFLAIILTTPASAQSVCMPRETLLQQIQKNIPHAVRTENLPTVANTHQEVWSNGQKWIQFVTSNRDACIIGMGLHV